MVKDFGYKIDSDGKPIKYVTGQLLDPRTTLEGGEFCAKMLKRGSENKEKPGETVHPDTAFRTGFVAVKVGLHAEDV